MGIHDLEIRNGVVFILCSTHVAIFLYSLCSINLKGNIIMSYLCTNFRSSSYGLRHKCDVAFAAGDDKKLKGACNSPVFLPVSNW